jgi:transcription antitermination factor NusG
MNWYAVSVTPRYEIETAARINSAGHGAYCPTFEKKYVIRRGGAEFSVFKNRPLFPTYIFIDADGVFHKDFFESSRIRMTVHRKSVVHGAQIGVVESMGVELSAAEKREPSGIKINVGDLVKFRDLVLADAPVEVLEKRKADILVQCAGWIRPAWVSADQVERVA